MKTSWKILVVLALGMTSVARAQTCTTIQQGGLVDVAGHPIGLGYDPFGYDYQAHMFNGPYDCYGRDATLCAGADPDHELIMKWNDAWLASSDCDGDRLLDRHYGTSGYRGSGAWLTNHESGLVPVGTKLRKWTYFCKIVAVPEDAVLVGPDFYAADGRRIGWAIWGDFAVTEEIYNDPSNGANGLLYKGLPGLGHLP